MDQSRLGPSLDEVPYALKRITDAGVRVYCYLTDKEVRRDTASDRFMMSAVAFVDDMHREQCRQRTYDATHRTHVLPVDCRPLRRPTKAQANTGRNRPHQPR